MSEPGRLDAVGAELVASWLRETPDAAFLAAMGTSPLGVYAGLAADWLGPRPEATFLVALGTSALGIYRELGRLVRGGALDTSRLRLVQLDEYAGLADGDDRLLRTWLERDVAGPLRIPAGQVIALASPDPGDELSVATACRDWDRAVGAAGGIDVAVLGLGPNGHLGFNEPPSPPDARTRLVALTDASLESNARYFPAGIAVPSHAVTAGMPAILGARRKLLVVTGEPKRPILRRLLQEPVSDGLPASHLRTVGGVTLLADRAAWPADVPVPAPGNGSRAAIPR